MYLFTNLEIYKRVVEFTTMLADVARQFHQSSAYIEQRFFRSSQRIREAIEKAHDMVNFSKQKDFLWEAREALWDRSGLIEIASKQNLINFPQKVDFRLQIDQISRLIQGYIHESKSNRSPTPGYLSIVN